MLKHQIIQRILYHKIKIFKFFWNTSQPQKSASISQIKLFSPVNLDDYEALITDEPQFEPHCQHLTAAKWLQNFQINPRLEFPFQRIHMNEMKS